MQSEKKHPTLPACSLTEEYVVEEGSQAAFSFWNLPLCFLIIMVCELTGSICINYPGHSLAA